MGVVKNKGTHTFVDDFSNMLIDEKVLVVPLKLTIWLGYVIIYTYPLSFVLLSLFSYMNMMLFKKLRNFLVVSSVYF
jgi:hypothetical protein